MPMLYGIGHFSEAKIKPISVSKTGMRINRYAPPEHIFINMFPGCEVLCYAMGFYAYRFRLMLLWVRKKGKD